MTKPTAMAVFNEGVVARAVREIPWRSRFDLLEASRLTQPKYCGEGKGTPRRALQTNMIDGIRIAPTFNPYVKLTAAKRYVLDNWPSRNWTDWDCRHCYVRGSRRRFNIPEDIWPYKDELGEWHPPKLSGRYKADVEKQYHMHGLPWVWEKDFYTGKKHFQDREPTGPKNWYRKELRQEKMREAMRNMDETILKYKKEVRNAKKLSWLEKNVKALARPAQISVNKFVRSRRIAKL